ncbi:DUF3073 domain-containing protein [Kineococcus gynurae]|uniref:DUF3073 domain-containing protein n=1 Tax=Kineococcus gynurae TaxID=452979 RepID=A0ABV5LRV3_9ACTN
MGRGRQKAKQTKVARQLKYFSPETDYNALQRELHGPDRFNPSTRPAATDESESTEDDEYYSRYAAEDDDDDWPSQRRA